MAHCSMFRHSDKHDYLQCVIDKKYREEFESLGFVRRADAVNKPKVIDGASLKPQTEVEDLRIEGKKYKIKGANLMKIETLKKKIAEAKDDH